MINKLKSIEDIARLAGVSKSTVSRALNDSPLVGAETRERILAIAKEHEFRPSAIARNLSMRTSRTIAFVTHAYCFDECCISDPFSLEIMGGIAIGLHALGYDMLVVHVDPDSTDWASSYLNSGKVDGFILMTSEYKKDHVERLREIGAPFIAWGLGAGSYSTVCGDDQKGGRLAVERLVSTGHRRIGFLGGPRIEPEVKERYQGFSDAMQDAGLDPKALVCYGDYTERSGEREMATMLAKDPNLDAVFANSDYMAISAMRIIKASGRRIPEDVAVIGYDDLAIAAYVSPALTTISQHVSMAGRILARDLIAYIEKGIITSTSMPVELVVRDSA
jgi:DNA-binding LacI/PurR family transcriptional regulator